MDGLGSAASIAVKTAKISECPRGNYLFNASIAGIEEADARLLIGSKSALKHLFSMRVSASAIWRANFRSAAIGEDDRFDISNEASQLMGADDTLADLLGGHEICRYA